VVAEVPDGIPIETQDTESLAPGWNLENSSYARTFGNQWLQEERTAILIVPSVIARLDANALVNPSHPDAKKLIVSLAEKIDWDKRLFGRL